jgi:hypothetical protein
MVEGLRKPADLLFMLVTVASAADCSIQASVQACGVIEQVSTARRSMKRSYGKESWWHG